MIKKKSQVWVETMIYTLIFFTLLGLVLGYAKPKIQEMNDKAIIEQSVGIIENIDIVVSSIIQGGPGNKRMITLGIKKGDFLIEPSEDLIIFDIDSSYTFTEPGTEIDIGGIKAFTQKTSKLNKITLTKNYSDYNITYNGEEKSKAITKSSNSYRLFISNKGITEDFDKVNLDFSIE